MRTLSILLCLLVATAAASEYGRAVRALRLDDRMRRRAALEAFAEGRLRAASKAEEDKLARTLPRFLSRRFPGSERALAVQALGRLRRPGAYGKILDWLEDETDDRVLHAAERAFRDAPEGRFDDLARRMEKADDPLHRAALIRMTGALPGEQARGRIRIRAHAVDHWCPRAAAAHALARDRDPQSFPPLIELLDNSDPGLVTAAVESLTRLTGLDYARDVIQWKTWWETRGKADPLAPPPKSVDPERRIYAHEVKSEPIGPYFFGIPVRARKVVFVFDVSASMRYKLPLAYDQLTRAVKGLASNCLFEVIFFNEHVWPWRGRLSHADPVTKELLVRHLPTIEIRSYTNLFDSIEKALSLDVDEVFVISDGFPNRGRRQLPKDILRELERINTKATKIHTISVVRTVDGDEHVNLLRSIAQAHGGEHVARTLK
ncbi:MAG: HEAT repeat domain-containing protein [Planctomycetota bacterium]|jgi:hypothetical protein